MMRHKYPAFVTALSGLVLLFSLLTFAQDYQGDDEVVENPLKAQLSIAPSRIPAGASGTLRLDLFLVPKHKAYVDMFKINWVKPADVRVGALSAEPKHDIQDKFSKKVRTIVTDKATVTASFEVPENLAGGKHDIEVEFTYQACSESYCLFPKTMTLKGTLETTAGHGTFVEGSGAMPSSLEQALMKGRLYAFLFVFIAGLLTSLTPCIFPMIPITLAVIGARSESRGRFMGFFLSIFYVLGIAFTYSLLGLAAARTGALFGSLLGHPVVVGAIAILFVTMGISMYGAFEIKLPEFITRRLHSKGQSGFIGAFITGLIAGVVASPCVGPVLVSILAWVARTQDMVLGFGLLFTFALGMGQLFIALGTFGSLSQKLPRSGAWMNAVKFIFGTIMIGMALFYLKPVLSDCMFDFLAGLATVLISGVYGAFTPSEKLTSVRAKLAKALALAAFIVGAALLVRSFVGLPSNMGGGPNASAGAAAENFKKLNWQPYSDALLQEAHKLKKPVIVDFWAEWCVSCHELEALTFTDPDVAQASTKFVLLKIDATKDSDDVQRLKKYYGVVGLPTLIFYGNGKIRPELTLTGFEKGPDFLARMHRASN